VYLNDGDGWVATPDAAWSAAWAQALGLLGGFAYEVVPLDVNGDGLVDLARDEDGDRTVDGDVLVNTGSGWIPSAQAGLTIPAELRPIDLDGDGLVDHAGNPVLLNRGTAFVPSAALPSLPGAFATLGDAATVEDLDGDGVGDLIFAPGSGIPITLLLSTEGAASERMPAGLVVGVDHASGGSTSLDYRATTEASCYDDEYGGCHAGWALFATGGACYLPTTSTAIPSLCAFPVETLPLALQTVERVTVDDRAGNVRVDRIAYDAGFYDASEREFVGFGVVGEAPSPDLWIDPNSGELVQVAPRRETRFFQAPFLRGAVASVDLFARPLPLTPFEVRLERQVHHYAVTRGDLDGTALLQSQGFLTTCDLADPGEVEEPEQSSCPDLVNLETSAYGALPLPAPLPYADFRARFGPGNPDAARAYLVLPVTNATLLYDGTLADPDPDDPLAFQTSRWHDPFGSVSAEWSKGMIGDDFDDRLAITAYAAPTAEAPPNLRTRPRWTVRQSVQGGAVLGSTSFEYDGLPDGEVVRGNLTRRLDGLGAETTRVDIAYPVESYGLPASATDPYLPGEPVRTTLQEYDASATFEVRRERGGLVTQRVLDPPGAPPGLGLVWQSIDENGGVETVLADGFGRALSRAGPSPIGAVETRSYDDFAGYDPSRPRIQVTVDDGAGNAVTTGIASDGLGRPVRIETSGLDEDDAPATRVQTFAYDVFGSLRERSLPHFAGDTPIVAATYRYDERGRLRYAVAADGGVEEVRRARLAETRIDAEGRETLRLRDGSGAVVLVREGAGAGAASTVYRFDALGRLRVICDAAVSEGACPAPTCSASECSVPAPPLPRHTTVIDYDSLGRKVRLVDPDQGEWTYAYDGRGELTLQRDARGREVAFEYDAQGRVVGEVADGVLDVVRVYGDDVAGAPAACGDLSAVAHRAGRVVCETGPEGTFTHRYDLPGRLVETRFAAAGAAASSAVGASYDWLNRAVAALHPDGETLAFGYDVMGLDRVTGVHEYLADARHDAAGSLVRLRFGNGVERVVERQATTGLPARSLDVGPGGPLVDRSLAYDLTRRLTSIIDGLDPAESLSAIVYDDRGRLSALDRGGTPLAWSHDAIGNLTGVEGRPLGYEHPAKPHALFESAEPARYQYDASGNLTVREGTVFEYDARGRLVHATGPLDRRYGHGPSGARIREERGARVSHYLGPDLEIRSVREPDGSLRPAARLVKTIRIDGLAIAQVARPLPDGPAP
jgi:YD repeat-containing protein